jgi:hypothetical protein
MFSWLQHLFTARALQSELLVAKARIAELELQLDKVNTENENLKNITAIRDQQPTCPISSLPEDHPIRIKRGW